MKVTDFETTFCHHIEKGMSSYYLMTEEGFVIKPIQVEKIQKIEFADMVISMSYDGEASFPIHASFDKTNGEHYMSCGCKKFSSIVEDIRQYTKEHERLFSRI